MSMTLLQLVTEFCERRGLDLPTNTVQSSTDDGIKQLRGLLNEGITDLTQDGESWPELQREATFVSVAAESQGQLSTIAPYGFLYIVQDTMYDRTQRIPIFGPRGAQLWQQAKALPYTGPWYSYRIWQGQINCQPNPPAGHTIAFEYASNYAVRSVVSSSDSTVTYRSRFTFDADVFLLDEDLLLLWLDYKWRAEKGLPCLVQKQAYEKLKAQRKGNDNAKPEINLSGGTAAISPGIFVAAGSWPVSN